MLVSREDEVRGNWRLMIMRETIDRWLTSIKYHSYHDVQEQYSTSIRHTYVAWI
jgi:hypothetical protein